MLSFTRSYHSAEQCVRCVYIAASADRKQTTRISGAASFDDFSRRSLVYHMVLHYYSWDYSLPSCQTPARLSAPSMHSEDPFPIISSSGISIGSSHGGDRDLHGLLVSKKAPRITRMCLQSSASKKLQRGVHPPRATGLQGMYQCISVSFPVQAMHSSTYCVPLSVQIPNPYKWLVTHVVEL